MGEACVWDSGTETLIWMLNGEAGYVSVYKYSWSLFPHQSQILQVCGGSEPSCSPLVQQQQIFPAASLTTVVEPNRKSGLSRNRPFSWPVRTARADPVSLNAQDLVSRQQEAHEGSGLKVMICKQVRWFRCAARQPVDWKTLKSLSWSERQGSRCDRQTMPKSWIIQE